jgi:putative ABC transport system permease protein
MIELFEINKSYKLKSGDKKQVLNGLSLKVQRSDFIAITGRSGSGKSTLLNIIGGLDFANSGTYHINQADMTQLTQEQWDLLSFEEIRVYLSILSFGSAFNSIRKCELTPCTTGI